ncbi:GbsR/MarR family transcriptional regulator [Streptomyces sp. NPDC057757]|uniref:GbsR/MarR family transcriptional regulator n=1 Tax=Streptomyces sp. NPDC057757 TaxID=3346241 RepID=UPI0036B25E13
MSRAADDSEAANDGEVADYSQLIEDFGLRIGRAMGWPPMAGRLAGILMLSPAPMTLSELQVALGASKGSASEMTRVLMANGTVDRVKMPGVRQSVYEWRDDAWSGCLQHQLDQNRQLLELAETAQESAGRLPPVQRARLRDMGTYYGFMVRQLQRLLDEYQGQLRTGER